MKLPKEVKKIIGKLISFDREDAGWYVPNSVIVRDCVPSWRLPGGGVVKDQLTDLPTAIDKSITHTKSRIADAEAHLKKLLAAKESLNA